MKIFFRYILLELIQPFVFILIACIALWVVADLFGTLDDFLEKGASWTIVLQFYLAQFPSIMVTMLPVALLFATLYTLLRLNSKSEFIAFMAGGISPLGLFTPFMVLAIACTAFLFYLMSGPVALAKQRRAMIMEELGGNATKKEEIRNLVWRDNKSNDLWYIGVLEKDSGKATDVRICYRDPVTNAAKETLYAESGQWNGTYWKLTNIRRVIHGPQGDKAPILAPGLEGKELKTSPLALSYVRAEPSQLTVSQLHEFLDNKVTENVDILAKYRTELNYNEAYPFSTVVLVLFALALGSEFGRRNVAAGVFNSIFVLIGFLFIHELCLSMGRGNRIPAFVAAWLPHVIFGSIAMWMLSNKFGWFWVFLKWLQRKGPEERLDGATVAQGGKDYLARGSTGKGGGQKKWSDRM
ncbi:hypothetical protein DB346_21605 [Verrucomicrobia bacterium LW23]|nr:hypothetical protein DB346_21605 [Verrucomicrobia bacterium LW23]